MSFDLDLCGALDCAEDEAFEAFEDAMRAQYAERERARAAARLPIYTIGYEGKSADELIDALLVNDVRVLIDVRELPISRKRGLSKTALSAACEAEAIGYVHLKALGNPKAIRKSGGTAEEIIDAFRAHLDAAVASGDPLVRAALDTVALLRRRGPVCLMCYEADETTCHRTVVAERLAGDLAWMRWTHQLNFARVELHAGAVYAEVLARRLRRGARAGVRPRGDHRDDRATAGRQGAGRAARLLPGGGSSVMRAILHTYSRALGARSSSIWCS